jgi:hypothetical protein
LRTGAAYWNEGIKMLVDDIRRHIQATAADDEQCKRLVTSVVGAVGDDPA